jgi:NosR/NirI family transcriptional regulator, nitrous oxide reductase regulator
VVNYRKVSFHFRAFITGFLVLFFIVNAICKPVLAKSLNEVLDSNPINQLFPDAARTEAENQDESKTEHSINIASVYDGAKQIGYLYLNSSIVNATGYSGKPIQVLIGLDMQGVIRSARLVEHSEPIVLIGIPEEKIRAVIDSYIGLDIVAIARTKDRELPYDALSGATVTVRVIDDSIIRSATKIARWYGLGGLTAEAPKDTGPQMEINSGLNEIRDWIDLIGDGSVRRLKLLEKDVNKEFAANGINIDADESIDEELFIELYAALVSVPSIGNSLLGEGEYKNLVKSLEPGKHAILLAANGNYSFKGSGYVRGGIFDRFEIIQNDNAIRFRDTHHKRLRQIEASGAPNLIDVDLFTIPADIEFDAVKAWELELLVSRETGPREKVFVTFNLSYETPENYLKKSENQGEANAQVDNSISSSSLQEEAPLWETLWREKIWMSALLVLSLVFLSWIFFFQMWLVKRPVLFQRIRTGFLIFTLFGIGFYANAQLSVVNILTVFSALITGFDWAYFLMEPLIFILWGSVAAAILFWGRGAYCGWLCPFGALQELLNKLAKLAKIPQYVVPWGIHERLWPLKYIIFMILFGVSLHSLGLAERLAEIEPFKTAIIMKFIRDWPYALFAIVVLAAGLFIERFYCRYLCPLGAALAIPARMRMFDWLKRYRQCGSPCQRCANECMVQAIHPEGNINPNECINCLHCQQLYTDEHNCPVMIQKSVKRARREGMSTEKTAGMASKILEEIKDSNRELK